MSPLYPINLVSPLGGWRNTRDAELAGRLAAALQLTVRTCSVASPEALDTRLERLDPAVLILDLRDHASRDILPRIRRTRPGTVVIALGIPRSDPMIEAEGIGVYAVEDIGVEPRPLRTLVSQALGYAELARENRILREDRPPAAPAAPPISPPGEGAAADIRIPSLFPALRHLADLKTLLEGVVETLVGSATVSRAGIFLQDHDGGPYRLAAGLKCHADTGSTEFEPADAWVRWLEANAHLVSRSMLEHAAGLAERDLLRRVLDAMGAEAIVPLYATGRTRGWLFVGRRATGLPFRYSDLERLTLIGEHLSAVLENALLYQEIRRQKTLAETLLQAIPIGIVAVAETGRVRWFNQAAQRLLDMPAERALGQPVETLGSRAADMIRRALQDEAAPPTKEWSDPLTKRDVSVQVRRLQDGGSCFGVMALIRDVTDEKRLQEKQNELDRARFWTQLAAAMSHEIRNPLVAISTFAQLLPERHEDPEFREEFSRIVQREVASLNAIIEQVHAFAHPASPAFRPLNLRQVVQKAVGTVSLKRDPSVAVEIETSFPPDLPDVQGDEQALTQCMVHLLDNALEAVSGVSKPKVRISGRRVGENGLSHVEISVSDNGAGIADDIRPRLFSPFCTTKTKGLGLGLPIVKRTLLDHSGDVQVDSGADGTTVTISIPALEPKETP